MLREVRNAVLHNVTAGEYGHDLYYFRRMCAAGAVDCLQADVSRCGGITEWLRVAAVAASHGLQISGHCGPHLHAHAAAGTPNLRHLEWFHDHVRIESLLFDGTLDPTGGAIRTDPAVSGLGLTLRTADAEPYRVSLTGPDTGKPAKGRPPRPRRLTTGRERPWRGGRRGRRNRRPETARPAAEPASTSGDDRDGRAAVTYGIVDLLNSAGSALILIGLGLFITAGLDPAVN